DDRLLRGENHGIGGGSLGPTGGRDCEISRLLRHATTPGVHSQLFHTTAESAGIQTQEPRGPPRTVNNPVRLLQDLGDVASLDLFQRDQPGAPATGGWSKDDLVGKIQHRAVCEYHGPLDDVLKLPDVSGPVVRPQPFHRPFAYALDLLAGLPRMRV